MATEHREVGDEIRMTRFYLRLAFVITIVAGMSGCLESSFVLAPESRLPKWFEVPSGMTRSELKVTLDYYSTGESVFKLYKKGSFFALKKVTEIPRSPHLNYLKNPPAGFPKGYPIYKVITVNGITDIIEHRKMEPIFYVTDDPNIWRELGVEQTKAEK